MCRQQLVIGLQTPAKEGLEPQELEDERREAPHTLNLGFSSA